MKMDVIERMFSQQLTLILLVLCLTATSTVRGRSTPTATEPTTGVVDAHANTGNVEAAGITVLSVATEQAATGVTTQATGNSTIADVPCPSNTDIRCVSNGLCLPFTYHCDGACDCPDCSDETDGCPATEITGVVERGTDSSIAEDTTVSQTREADAESENPLLQTGVVEPGTEPAIIGTESSITEGATVPPQTSEAETENLNHQTGVVEPGTEPAIIGTESSITEGATVPPQTSEAETENLNHQTESRVPCLNYEFECLNGLCINIAYKCDWNNDCGDNSDEKQCDCLPTQFQCHNRRCIGFNLNCNRKVDCSDGSDELNCPGIPWPVEINETFVTEGMQMETELFTRPTEVPEVTGVTEVTGLMETTQQVGIQTSASREPCLNYEFQCLNGRCINNAFMCDWNNDCGDDSDEMNCGCSSAEFQCNNRRCLAIHFLCNGIADCADASDEQNCAAKPRSISLPCRPNATVVCSDFQYECANGQCVNRAYLCDKNVDCCDGSDESITAGCRCGTDQYACFGSGRCLPLLLRCNNRIDCTDGSDELGC